MCASLAVFAVFALEVTLALYVGFQPVALHVARLRWSVTSSTAATPRFRAHELFSVSPDYSYHRHSSNGGDECVRWTDPGNFFVSSDGPVELGHAAALARYDMLTESVLTFQRVLDDAGIWNIAIAGTLLGAIRHGTNCPWEDDADFAVALDDVERILALAPTFAKLGFDIDSTYRVIKVVKKPCSVELAWGLSKWRMTELWSDYWASIVQWPSYIQNCLGAKIWIDVFVVDPVCFDRETGTCRCVCKNEMARNDDGGFFQHGGDGENFCRAAAEKKTTHGLCDDEDWQAREAVPFANGALFGPRNATAYLRRVYGDGFGAWMSGGGSHNWRETTPCRHRAAEEFFCRNKIGDLPSSVCRVAPPP